MTSDAWKKAKDRMKRRACVSLDDCADSTNELRFEESGDGQSIKVSICGQSVTLDYWSWEAIRQVGYELHVEKPEPLEEAVKDLCGDIEEATKKLEEEK